MSTSHQHSIWSVGTGEALSLDIGPGPRELSVTEGRLWLTLRGDRLDQQPEDHWLEPGQSVELPAGSRVVMEAWPQAAFQLLVPPCPKKAARPGISALWRRFVSSSPTSSSASSLQAA